MENNVNDGKVTSMEAELRALQATVTAGFRETHRRINDTNASINRGMGEVSRRLDVTNGKVINVSERMIVVESIIKGLETGYTKLRERYHDLNGKVQRLLGSQREKDDDNDDSLKRGDLKDVTKVVIVTATLTTGIILWILKMIGKI